MRLSSGVPPRQVKTDRNEPAIPQCRAQEVNYLIS
jgi:hypothetical protein